MSRAWCARMSHQKYPHLLDDPSVVIITVCVLSNFVGLWVSRVHMTRHDVTGHDGSRHRRAGSLSSNLARSVRGRRRPREISLAPVRRVSSFREILRELPLYTGMRFAR